jgi:hypothetical protein
MYSITENIYYSQLSSVAILLQPERVSHRIIQGKHWVLSPYVLSSCGLPLPPTCLLLTINETRSYFASTIDTDVSEEHTASIRRYAAQKISIDITTTVTVSNII